MRLTALELKRMSSEQVAALCVAEMCCKAGTHSCNECYFERLAEEIETDPIGYPLRTTHNTTHQPNREQGEKKS